jgi:protein tyrosine phosphatase (PTP) superfamily phosphohydrolase (DUF442 family)
MTFGANTTTGRAGREGLSLRRVLIALAVAAVLAGGVWLLLGPAVMRSNDRRTPAPGDAATGWAQPLDEPGLPNLYRVSDELYRGAQPTAEGMQRLKEMGVRTVVNLRSFHSDRDEIGETGLGYEHITMKAYHPEDKEVVRFLRIVNDPARQPVFVHCQHGADRTGLMAAVYRVAVQGWTKDQAIAEMTRGGFGFHDVFEETLVDYLRELDLSDMCRQAGVEPASR